MNVCMDICGRGSFLISGIIPTTKYSKLISVYNDVFYHRCEIQNRVFYAVLQYVGPAEVAAKYQYKVEFFNKDRTESLAVGHLVRSFLEDLNEVHSSGILREIAPRRF